MRTPESKGVAEGVPEVDATDGCFPIPTAPGLGVKLNEGFIAEHQSEGAFFDLFQHDWQFRQGTKKLQA
ncbi:MAG: hypothetical protein NVS4B12_13840 [Ktedonobacteraceae bacterium]